MLTANFKENSDTETDLETIHWIHFQKGKEYVTNGGNQENHLDEKRINNVFNKGMWRETKVKLKEIALWTLVQPT